MPGLPIERLPESSRVWIFGASTALNDDQSARLLGVVDEFLAGWSAHGTQLDGARELLEGRFLIVAVDPGANPSGCSIDRLFATLQPLERELSISLLDSGRIFFRDGSGAIHSVDRAAFRELARSGEISGSTPVFDTTIERLADLRSNHLERHASDSWHARAFTIAEHEPAVRQTTERAR